MFLVMAPTFSTSWYLQQPILWPQSALSIMRPSHAICCARRPSPKLLKCTVDATHGRPVSPFLETYIPCNAAGVAFSGAHDQAQCFVHALHREGQQGLLTARTNTVSCTLSKVLAAWLLALHEHRLRQSYRVCHTLWQGSSLAQAPDGEVEEDLARLVEGGDHAALGHARLVCNDHVRDRLRSMAAMLRPVIHESSLGAYVKGIAISSLDQLPLSILQTLNSPVGKT